VVSVLRTDYGRLRTRLESLQAQPEKDTSEVDRLERIQLDIKAELVNVGNNLIE